MSTLERAIVIAAEAHAGITDKGGAPDILHPLRMMMDLNLPKSVLSPYSMMRGEDCPGWTFERLRGEGFSEEILAALDLVTKREGETYEEFALRAAINPIGRRVKLADLRDNSDLARIANPSVKDHQRIAKYVRAMELIRNSSE